MCGGDFWGGRTSFIFKGTGRSVTVKATTNVNHILNHSGCQGDFYVMAFLVDSPCESGVSSESHYSDGRGQTVWAEKPCSGLSVLTSYRGGGGHSGFGENSYESTSTDSVSFDDNDNDGYSPDDSPADCIDNDASAYPGATLDCGTAQCNVDKNCNGNPDCNDCGESPILIDLDTGGVRLTNAADGVLFDLVGSGIAQRLGWTRPGSKSGWLALDRNGNALIDNGSELFGNWTPQPPSPQPNGFLGLAEFDKPAAGGNSDGQIDPADAVYSRLRVWVDGNHDGVSQAQELLTLVQARVDAISVDYRVDNRKDRWGNLFKYRAPVSAPNTHFAYDVFLVSAK
jgi:hypothetical protein